MFDGDGNGVITIDELTKLLEKVGWTITDDQARGLFVEVITYLDTDYHPKRDTSSRLTRMVTMVWTILSLSKCGTPSGGMWRYYMHNPPNQIQ